jgi:hypothetical protein
MHNFQPGRIEAGAGQTARTSRGRGTRYADRGALTAIFGEVAAGNGVCTQVG